MRHPLYKFLQAVIPPCAFLFFVNLIEKFRFYLSGFSGVIKVNSKMRYIAEKDEVFLLATGPSVKKQDLALLKGRKCVSVSNFFLHKDIDIIKPEYHFFCGIHPPLIPGNIVELFRQADEKLPANTKIISGHRNKSLIEENNIFSNREVFYLYHSLEKHRCKFNLTKPVFSPRNGALMVIPVLLYMGYKKINLIGSDCNRLMDYNKIMKNFYSPDEDIRKRCTDEWGAITEEVENVFEVMKQFDFFNDIAKNKYNASIVNLSPDSWLHMFEYVDYDSAVKN